MEHRIFFKLGKRVYEMSPDLANEWARNGNGKLTDEFALPKGQSLVIEDDYVDTVRKTTVITLFGDWKNG